MFKVFWKYISGIGIRQDEDEKLSKRIRLTNQFNLIGLIIFLVNGINNWLIGDLYSAITIETFSLVCLLGFYLNYLHYYQFTTILLFVSIESAIFYFDSYSGIESGTYLYYFPIVLAIAFIFDFTKEKTKILSMFGLFLIYLLINTFTHRSLFKNHLLKPEDQYQMFMLNLFFSIGSVCFFIYLMMVNNIKENDIYESRINERKQSEEAIKQALSEKEILLAELHHRVKNNLAVIAGLFSLKIGTLDNEEAKNVLIESKNRVSSMGLIHNRLYKNESLSDIDFVKYIEDLIFEIKSSYPSVSNMVEVCSKIEDIKLDINQAIPLGLILNELLSNCYKHAFNGLKQGKIDIKFSRFGDTITLIVKDNGHGLKPNYDQTDSIGITVIQSLSEQLDGECSYISDGGTTFSLSFKQ